MYPDSLNRGHIHETEFHGTSSRVPRFSESGHCREAESRGTLYPDSPNRGWRETEFRGTSSAPGFSESRCCPETEFRDTLFRSLKEPILRQYIF